uniref:Uncharacterized protein n=1 Tax=Aegilops tauschii subsp. strangulata TaxID=200361 RepID=A0A453LQY0_AEGTS
RCCLLPAGQPPLLGDPMAMDTSPRLYRRLRKASDISIATTAPSSSKRVRGHPQSPLPPPPPPVLPI